MGYRLDPQRPLPAELRRVAEEQADKALASLRHRPEGIPAAVHDARKRCKKIRGVLRLARPALSAAYAAENARYREAAALLSGLRDADALLETAGRLRARFGDQVRPRLFDRLEERLQDRRQRQRAAAGDPEELCEAAAGRIEEGRRALAGLPFPAEIEPLAQGLKKTYRRGRDACDTCRNGADADAFHEWRKRVKYHGYHLRLLQAAWPPALKARRKAFEELADLLGDDHDLAVFLAADAEEDGLLSDPRDRELLHGVLHARSAALRGEALRVAPQLFAEPPKALRRRLAKLWRAAAARHGEAA